MTQVAILNGHIADKSNQEVPENTADKPTGEKTEEQKHFSKYFVVRDVLPKTSQDLIDVLMVMLLKFFQMFVTGISLYVVHQCEYCVQNSNSS